MYIFYIGTLLNLKLTQYVLNHFYKKYAITENWIPNKKHEVQLINNQYTRCTKIQSIDDINKLYNEFNIQS